MILSVIIPTHNRRESLSHLIEALSRQKTDKKNLQVIVVSNLRDPELTQLSKKWKSAFYDFKLLTSGKRNVNSARNLGIRFAAGDVLYFLDDDCMPDHPEHLQNLLRLHQIHKNTTAVGGGYKLCEDASPLQTFYHSQAMGVDSKIPPLF